MRNTKLSERDIRTTVAGFYNVLLGDATWNEALTPLLSLFNINCVHFLEFDTVKHRTSALGAVGVRSASEIAADVVAYDGYYHKIDVRIAHTLRNQVGKVTTCRDYCDDQFVLRNEVYQDYLIPRGCEFLMAAKVARRHDDVALIGILRSGKQQRYSTTELAYFEPLVHHLGRAMQLQWHLQGLEKKLFAQTQALDAFTFGVLAVDGIGDIYHVNFEAEHFLRRVSAIKVSHGRIRCGLASDQNRWEQLLNSVINNGISDGMRLRDAATLQEWILWAVPAGDGLGFTAKKLAVVVITNPKRPWSIDTLLQRMFGFTSAETKLANALAAGETVAAYAEREQLSIATVRTHVRSILSKAGVARQADFLRLIASAGLISTV